MPKQKTYMVYKFNELSEESQEKAISNLYDINVNYRWWESIYEDANTIGLRIAGFDIDRGNRLTGKMTLIPRESMEAIIENHGKDCETYKTAEKYLARLNALDMDDSHFEAILDDIIYNYEYDLKEDYLSILKKEYEYLTSDEAIKQTIEANDYDFRENGTLD